MVGEQDSIIRGPELDLPEMTGSVGQLLFPLFKTITKEQIVQVDGETGESVTAGELLDISVQTAEGLKQLGVKPGDVICFCVRNSHQVYYSAIASIWLSATVAPIDPALKVYEMGYQLNILQPDLVFCDENVVDTVVQSLKDKNLSSRVIVLGQNSNVSDPLIKFSDLLKPTNTESFEPLPITDPKQDLFSIMFSSGTTGLPKGVGLSHWNIWYQLHLWNKNNYHTSFLTLTQFFWASGLVMLVLSLKVHFRRTFVMMFDPLQTLKTIDRYKPSWILLSPAELLSVIRHQDFSQYDVSSVKLIQAVGAPMSEILTETMKKVWTSDKTLVSGYGMTEMCGLLAIPDPNNPNSVGKPVPGCSLKVVDVTTGKALGPNEKGEFCFKSNGVMRGYFRNEEATRGIVDSGGWLHTGDLGYYDQQYYLYIVDKIKEFIKYRTWQIPPAELESIIEMLPGVIEVAVAGIPHEEDIYHPMALVVKDAGSTITSQDIIKYVADLVADYKQLRAGVRFVDKLPRTPTGKLRRVKIKTLANKLYQQS